MINNQSNSVQVQLSNYPTALHCACPKFIILPSPRRATNEDTKQFADFDPETTAAETCRMVANGSAQGATYIGVESCMLGAFRLQYGGSRLLVVARACDVPRRAPWYTICNQSLTQTWTQAQAQTYSFGSSYSSYGFQICIQNSNDSTRLDRSLVKPKDRS